jgi:hypothetical protein
LALANIACIAVQFDMAILMMWVTVVMRILEISWWKAWQGSSAQKLECGPVIIGEEFPVPSSTGVVETGDPLHIAEESEGNPRVVKPYECSRSGPCSSNVREVDEMGYGARGISSRSLGNDDDDSLNAEQELAYLYEARAAAGIVYLLGYSEVHCKQDTSFLKKLLINVYSYLRRNCRTSELYLRIPHSRLLKVGMTYYV